MLLTHRQGISAKIIAVANNDLEDSDPRKITRHSVWIIRKLADDMYDLMHPGALGFQREARQLADALESYLPPEGP